MKAIVCTKYGTPDLLQLMEVGKPTPKDDEVLVKVRASSVNYNNLGHVSGKPFLARLFGFGLLKPKIKIPGSDLAGQVEEVGKNVKQFQPGDAVFGDVSSSGYGAWAEYVCVPEYLLALKPANLNFEQAATGPQAGAYVALQALRDRGQIQKGQRVLINGASGGIGTFAVQIAKHFGAEVTGVCSTRNVDLVRSLGADQVIDYMKEDFVKSGRQYDLIVATAGYRSICDYKRALSSNGIYVCTGGSMRGTKAMAQVYQALLLGPLISRKGGKKMGSMLARPNQKDLVFMRELIEGGKVKPVVDRYYPLNEVPEALSYYEQGHARGKIVISVEHVISSGRRLL